MGKTASFPYIRSSQSMFLDQEPQDITWKLLGLQNLRPQPDILTQTLGARAQQSAGQGLQDTLTLIHSKMEEPLLQTNEP